jgi:MoxR-like ATPase
MSIEQDYPDADAEKKVTWATTGSQKYDARAVGDPETVLAMQRLAREVPVVPSVKDFAVAIVRASRPKAKEVAELAERSVRLGASPRAAQALLLGAKVTALARGRSHVTRQDVIDVTEPVMAHRLLMDLRAQAEGRKPKEVINALIEKAFSRAFEDVSVWTKELLHA